MKHGRRKLAPVMMATSAAFLLLAAITGLFGTGFGLDSETANILVAVFLFIAVADAFSSIFLKHRSGRLSARDARQRVNESKPLQAPAADRHDLDRAEDEGMIAR